MEQSLEEKRFHIKPMGERGDFQVRGTPGSFFCFLFVFFLNKEKKRVAYIAERAFWEVGLGDLLLLKGRKIDEMAMYFF